jgi:hypothetical protein
MEKEELEVLIEIRDFFRRHKQEIAKELGESDNALREALKDVKDTSYYSITELKRQIVEQSEAFKDIINEEPVLMSDGRKYPPFEIYRISNFGGTRTEISFRLSVVEIDIDSIEMKELDYWGGTVSFENPNILLTEVGKIE